MPIDAIRDHLVEMGDVPRVLEETIKKRLNLATLYRWQSRGIAGIKLETILVGGKRFTTVEALNRFFAQSTLAKQGRLSIATKEGMARAAAIRQKQIDREADSLGI